MFLVAIDHEIHRLLKDNAKFSVKFLISRFETYDKYGLPKKVKSPMATLYRNMVEKGILAFDRKDIVKGNYVLSNLHYPGELVGGFTPGDVVNYVTDEDIYNSTRVYEM